MQHQQQNAKSGETVLPPIIPSPTHNNRTSPFKTRNSGKSRTPLSPRSGTLNTGSMDGRRHSEGCPKTADDFRYMIGSPPPFGLVTNEDQEVEFFVGNNSPANHSSIFPSIKVQKCDDSKPIDIPHGLFMPRSKSSNNLLSPAVSPILNRRRRSDPRSLANFQTESTCLALGPARSEGNLPNAIHERDSTQDPRFKRLEAVLQPVYPKERTRPWVRRSSDAKSQADDTDSQEIEIGKIPKPASPIDDTDSYSNTLHVTPQCSSRNCLTVDFGRTTPGSPTRPRSQSFDRPRKASPSRLTPLLYGNDYKT